MEEQLINFSTAKLAKEKGFDEQCNDCYNGKGYLYSNGWCERVDEHFEESFSNSELEQVFLYYFTAPTQSLLQKWLRETHHLIITIAYQYEHDSTPYSYWIYKENNSLPINQWVNDLNTYEEALEAGLQKALSCI